MMLKVIFSFVYCDREKQFFTVYNETTLIKPTNQILGLSGREVIWLVGPANAYKTHCLP